MGELLQPLLRELISLAVLGLTGLLGLAAHRAADWLRLSGDEKARIALLDAVDVVMDALQERVEARLLPTTTMPPPGRDAVLAEEIGSAANYLASRLAQRLTRLGIDDKGLRDLLQKRAEARGLLTPSRPTAPILHG